VKKLPGHWIAWVGLIGAGVYLAWRPSVKAGPTAAKPVFVSQGTPPTLGSSYGWPWAVNPNADVFQGLGALQAGAFRGQVGSVVQLGALARLPPFDNSLPYFQVGKTTVGYRRGGTRTVQLPQGRQVVMRDRRG